MHTAKGGKQDKGEIERLRARRVEHGRYHKVEHPSEPGMKSTFERRLKDTMRRSEGV